MLAPDDYRSDDDTPATRQMSIRFKEEAKENRDQRRARCAACNARTLEAEMRTMRNTRTGQQLRVCGERCAGQLPSVGSGGAPQQIGVTLLGNNVPKARTELTYSIVNELRGRYPGLPANIRVFYISRKTDPDDLFLIGNLSKDANPALFLRAPDAFQAARQLERMGLHSADDELNADIEGLSEDQRGRMRAVSAEDASDFNYQVNEVIAELEKLGHGNKRPAAAAADRENDNDERKRRADRDDDNDDEVTVVHTPSLHKQLAALEAQLADHRRAVGAYRGRMDAELDGIKKQAAEKEVYSRLEMERTIEWANAAADNALQFATTWMHADAANAESAVLTAVLNRSEAVEARAALRNAVSGGAEARALADAVEERAALRKEVAELRAGLADLQAGAASRGRLAYIEQHEAARLRQMRIDTLRGQIARLNARLPELTHARDEQAYRLDEQVQRLDEQIADIDAHMPELERARDAVVKRRNDSFAQIEKTRAVAIANAPHGHAARAAMASKTMATESAEVRARYAQDERHAAMDEKQLLGAIAQLKAAMGAE